MRCANSPTNRKTAMRDKVDIPRITSDRTALVRMLESAGAVFKTAKVCKCPFHTDKHASAGIYEKEGIWRFKCQSTGCEFGGTILDVQAKITGKSVADILRDMAGNDAPRKSFDEVRAKPVQSYPTTEAIRGAYRNVEDLYCYTHPDTKIIELAIVRFRDSSGDKCFHQFHPTPNGFQIGAPPKPWPLFNRTRLRTATEVWIVEGEKAAKALQAVGHVATTSPCGAGKAMHADWRPCAGKTCFLWPDNDPVNEKGIRTGIAHMEEVAHELSKLEPRPLVLWINPDELGLGPKDDAYDFLLPYEGDMVEATSGLDAVRSIAKVTGPAEELQQLIEDTISGKRTAIPWPWRGMTSMTKALFPGTVTCICGDPGCSKSLAMLEASAYWHKNGVKIAINELEDDRSYHLNRVLAQLEDNSNITDDSWIRENPDAAREAFARQRDFINSFGARMDTKPDGEPTLDELVAWTEKQCQGGARVLVIDPITAADSGDKPYLADRKFMLKVKGIVRASGSSMILVTHPKLSTKGGSPLSSMAGGAAFPRFAHTVVWIHRHDTPKPVRCSGPHGAFATEISRSFKIGKARNGKGSGVELGFNFDVQSLRMVEQGTVIKPKKDRIVEDPTEGVYP